jgi:transposase
MTTMIIGVDLADASFEVAIANVQYEIQQRKRSSRLRFTLFCEQLPPSLFLMEACSAAHHWARVLRGQAPRSLLTEADWLSLHDDPVVSSVTGKSADNRC